MFGRRKSDLEATFQFKRLEQLERQIRSQSTLEAVDFQGFIDQKIQNLAQRLALPLDAPIGRTTDADRCHRTRKSQVRG